MLSENDTSEIMNDLYSFYQSFVASRYDPVYEAEHIDVLAMKLMELYFGEFQRLCVAMPPRHKLADSTPILTANRGWVTHGELSVGDYVFGSDGEPTKIIGVSDKSLCDRLITFSDGSKVLAHEDHLWSVYLQDMDELVTIPTSTIENGLEKDYVYYLPKVNHEKITGNCSYRNISITCIETVTPEMGKCIEIENQDGIYLCGENLIPTHNSKSSMVTLAFPLWLIFQNPNLNILIVNSEAGLSEKFGIQLRELVKKYGKYFNVYLSDKKHSSTHLMFTDNKGELYLGSIRLVGADGSITGQDADYLIIDDPYKGYKDITPTLLQKKIDWFDTIIEQRLEDHSKLIILHTRWHSDDLQGHFKKHRADQYEFIEFPAIKPDGNVLWPEKVSLESLEKKREVLKERLFQSIFQQKPIDDTSDFFDLKRIHWERPDMEIVQMVRGWDMASSDSTEGDFTAGVPMYLLNDNKSVLITDYVHGQFGKETTATVKEQVKLDGHDNISIIETGVAAAGQLLYNDWEDQLEGYFVERAMAVPNNSKADRATPLKNKIYDGEVYIDIIDDKLRKTFIDEFKAFPVGKHDDIVDATAHAFNYLNKEFIGLDVIGIVDI